MIGKDKKFPKIKQIKNTIQKQRHGLQLISLVKKLECFSLI